MYRYYNANPKNNDITDCFIRSLSCATGKSWDYTYNKISDMAQWEGTTMDNADFIIKYLDRNYERMPKFYGTIEDAGEFYNKDIILVTTQGHIVCVKRGLILDTWDSSHKPVQYIWRVD